MRFAWTVIAAVACSKSAKAPDRITCAQYFDHVGTITGTPVDKPYGEGELALCASKTQEQLRCVLAAKTPDELNLCELADTSQRARAAKLWPSIKARWSGTATTIDIVSKGAIGCAVFSFPRGDLVTDERALVAFAIRTPATVGDAESVLATLARVGDDWHCQETDPPGRCAELVQSCRP